MKTLVYITNYEGNIKVGYLNKILGELNVIPFLDIEVIIFTTEILSLDDFDNITINPIVKPKVFSNSPYKTNWQPEPEFIWLHRVDLIDKIGLYELYIHIEDDICLTEENLKTFLEYGDKVGDGYIIGNIAYEKLGDEIILPQFHDKYKGIGGVVEINSEKYITTKNNHQGSWVATNKQIKLLVDSGYLKPTPSLVGDYNIKCSAVVEVYSTPKLKKVIPIKALDSLLIEHLTKNYIVVSKDKNTIWFNGFQTIGEIKNLIKNI